MIFWTVTGVAVAVLTTCFFSVFQAVCCTGTDTFSTAEITGTSKIGVGMIFWTVAGVAVTVLAAFVLFAFDDFLWTGMYSSSTTERTGASGMRVSTIAIGATVWIFSEVAVTVLTAFIFSASEAVCCTKSDFSSTTEIAETCAVGVGALSGISETMLAAFALFAFDDFLWVEIISSSTTEITGASMGVFSEVTLSVLTMFFTTAPEEAVVM